MSETLGSAGVSTKLQQIAELAKRKPEAVLTTLSHHIDLEFLKEAYRRTRKDGAAGVDEMSAKESRETSMRDSRRCWSGSNRERTWAPPVRRVHIPKGIRVRCASTQT
jgi:RNA-directed DNA polymerase